MLMMMERSSSVSVPLTDSEPDDDEAELEELEELLVELEEDEED